MAKWLEAQRDEVTDLAALAAFINALVLKAGQKTVLMIDEVDKSSELNLY